MTDAVKASAGRLPPIARAGKSKPAPHRERSLTQVLKNVASKKRNPPKTRAGRKGIVIYVEQDMALAIRRLAADYGTSVQALGEMAFKRLFEKLGEPSRI